MSRQKAPTNNKKSKNLSTYHDEGKVNEIGSLIGRAKLAAMLGTQFEGKRNLYDALGYDRWLTYDLVAIQYDRQEIARAVIDRPVNATWQGNLEISEGSEEDETQLEKQFKQLEKRLRLKSKFKRLDKLASLGNYGVLLLGLNDTKTKQDFAMPVQGGNNKKLLYVKPYSQGSTEIKTYVDDPNDERYGLPETYQIQLNHPSSDNSQDLIVHWSRIIHVTGELMESEIQGTSELKGIWNRLKDLEKLLGGSAEMFWLGARPGYQANVTDDANMVDVDFDKLEDQLAEHEHNMRRFLQTQGVDIKPLAQQIADPEKHFEIQVAAVSAEKGIPKRILMGSERGELSSGQDRKEWMEKIQNRREEYAEPQVVRAFVDRCIAFGILPKAGEEDYEVKWSDLFAPSEKDKADVGKVRAEALKAYANTPAIQEVISPEQFVQHFLGLDDTVVDKILEEMEQMMRDDQSIETEIEEQ